MDYHSPEGSTSQLAGKVPNPTDLSRRLESTQQEQQAKENWSDDENLTATPSRSPNNGVSRVDLQAGTHLWDTFSPSPTNRSPVNLQCCCGNDDCSNLAAFLRSLKSMEDQLRLAAEIGQALLQQQGVYQDEIKEYQQKLEHQKKLLNTANTLESKSINDINECARYQQKIAELEDLVHEFESTQRTLAIEKEDATRQKNILENKSEALTEALESSDKRVVELTNEIERLDHEVKRLMANNLMGERIEEREEILSRQLEDLKQELHVSRKAEFAAESKVKKLQAKYDQLCINLEKLEKEQQGSRKSRGKLEAVAMLRESKLSQPNLNNEANSHLIALIKELSSANNKLKSEISEYRELLSESRNEVSSLQNRIEDFETTSTVGYFHPSNYAMSTFQPHAHDEMGENQPTSPSMFVEETGESNNIPGTAARSINPLMSPNPSFGPGSYNTLNSMGVDPSVHSPVGSVVSSSMLSSSNPLHHHHHYHHYHILNENNDIVRGNVFGELEKYYKKPKTKGPRIIRGPKKSRRGTIPEFDEKAEDQLNDENITPTDATEKKYPRSEGYESASGASDQCYNEPIEEEDDMANESGSSTIKKGDITKLKTSHDSSVNNIESQKRPSLSLLSAGLKRSAAGESNPINQEQEQGGEKSPTKKTFDRDTAQRRTSLSSKRMNLAKVSPATTSAQQHKPTQSSPLAVHRRNASNVTAIEVPQSSNSSAVAQQPKELQMKPSIPAFKNPKFATLGPKERKSMMEAWRAGVAKEQQQKDIAVENDGLGSAKTGNQSAANNDSGGSTIKGKNWKEMPNSPVKLFVEGVLVDETNLSAAEAAAVANEVQHGLAGSGTKPANSCQASNTAHRNIPLLITTDNDGSKRVPQFSESFQKDNPYHLLFNLASYIMDRMKGTDLMALNRRLKRTFDILELTDLSNNLIENILNDVEGFRERFRWVEDLCNNDEMKTNPKMAFNDMDDSENGQSQREHFMFSPEYFLPLVHLLQDLLTEIGKLRMIINDVQVSYVQKVEESRRKAEEEFGQSVLGGKDDERFKRRGRAQSQSSDGGFGAYLSRVFGGVKEVQSITPARHHSRRLSVDFLHDRDVSVGSIDTFAEDNYYIDRNLEAYIRTPSTQRVYKRRESTDSSVGSFLRHGVISLFGGVGNSTSGKKGQKIDRTDNSVNTKNGKTKNGDTLASGVHQRRIANIDNGNIPSKSRRIRNLERSLSADVSSIPIISPSSTTIQYFGSEAAHASQPQNETMPPPIATTTPRQLRISTDNSNLESRLRQHLAATPQANNNPLGDQNIDGDYNGSLWDKFFRPK